MSRLLWHTNERTVESSAVFSLNWIRNCTHLRYSMVGLFCRCLHYWGRKYHGQNSIKHQKQCKHYASSFSRGATSISDSIFVDACAFEEKCIMARQSGTICPDPDFCQIASHTRLVQNAFDFCDNFPLALRKQDKFNLLIFFRWCVCTENSTLAK